MSVLRLFWLGKEKSWLLRLLGWVRGRHCVLAWGLPGWIQWDSMLVIGTFLAGYIRLLLMTMFHVKSSWGSQVNPAAYDPPGTKGWFTGILSIDTPLSFASTLIAPPTIFHLSSPLSSWWSEAGHSQACTAQLQWLCLPWPCHLPPPPDISGPVQEESHAEQRMVGGGGRLLLWVLTAIAAAAKHKAVLSGVLDCQRL